MDSTLLLEVCLKSKSIWLQRNLHLKSASKRIQIGLKAILRIRLLSDSNQTLVGLNKTHIILKIDLEHQSLIVLKWYFNGTQLVLKSYPELRLKSNLYRTQLRLVADSHLQLKSGSIKLKSIVQFRIKSDSNRTRRVWFRRSTVASISRRLADRAHAVEFGRPIFCALNLCAISME